MHRKLGPTSLLSVCDLKWIKTSKTYRLALCKEVATCHASSQCTFGRWRGAFFELETLDNLGSFFVNWRLTLCTFRLIRVSIKLTLQCKCVYFLARRLNVSLPSLWQILRLVFVRLCPVFKSHIYYIKGAIRENFSWKHSKIQRNYHQTQRNNSFDIMASCEGRMNEGLSNHPHAKLDNLATCMQI